MKFESKVLKFFRKPEYNRILILGIVFLLIPLFIEWMIFVFKNNPNKVMRFLIVIIVIFIAFGGFYWFSMRPANIRKDCVKSIGNRPLSGDYANGLYKKCLIEHGLKN